MDEAVALLLTDIVDSAALAQQIGDGAMAQMWAAHDRLARDLLRDWRGREIDKADGFLLMFAQASDALGYALAYHRALGRLEPPLAEAAGTAVRLRARAGLHVGPVSLRENPAADVALGAKPLEVDGVIKPVAARVMSTALGGQTLLTKAAVDALGAVPQRRVSHGHWRFKGLPAPLELFEVGEDGAPFTPPPDADKVYRVVRDGELWLPARELRHTLPAERDAFVGREGALQELAQRYEQGARLLSVLGIGGTGKTRLATRFGWTWMGDYPGGVWFCDLAPARSVEGLASAVAQGLELPLGSDDPIVQIGHAIAGRGNCLVILDNFEQLARHAEATLGRWLGRAPEARFLVTTREVLGITGEMTLALAPLQAADAEALFLRRAAQRDFHPGADEQAAIPPLVKLLDGLPLAIELAAARVRTLPPRALLARMSERFKLLASSRGSLDRQATLRAAFDWSWDLMAPAEKAALAQLSVFEGGFRLEAAEAVIDLSSLGGVDAPWTVDVLNSLVDKSFVRPLAGGRFDLLVSVQAYAAEHLRTEGRYPGSGPAALAEAQARHGAWFAALGPERAVEGACADLDNLVEACRRAVQGGDAELAAGALDGAWAALSLHGPFKAGVDLAEAVCGMSGLEGRAAAHGSAVLAAALHAGGERSEAVKRYEIALLYAQQCGDTACEAEVTVNLSSLRARAGDADRARADLQQALRQAHSLCKPVIECAAQNGLGSIEFECGIFDAAQLHYESGLALAQRIGNRRWEGSLLSNLGSLQAYRGALDQARIHCEQALEIARAIGDRKHEGNRLCNLGLLYYLQGRMEDAAISSEAAHRVALELGHARLECISLCNLGLVYSNSGRLLEALRCFEAALAIARQIGDHRAEGQILGHQGLAHARAGAFATSRQCLAFGEAILRQTSDQFSLGLLLCNRAEAECLAGSQSAGEAVFKECVQVAAETNAGPNSELGQALTRLRRLIGEEGPEAAISRPG